MGPISLGKGKKVKRPTSLGKGKEAYMPRKR